MPNTGSVTAASGLIEQNVILQTGSGNNRPDKNADDFIGKTIEGKYRLDARIGAGGMGTVYLATRLMINDTVAIKVLHSESVKDSDAERFRREAQAAARLKHPNAVQIYDFGVSSEGLVYLVMELVEGESLRSIIKNQGPLTPSAAAEVMRQTCAALDEAHAAHIIHRDVKPDNIIVRTTPQGLRVKVLDFGIAKLRDMAATNLTQTGSVMGTPHYMSPEQCMGEEIDSRSDVYSLGVVLYEMLAGVVPFNSPTSTAVVVQHVTQAPPPLRQINMSIPPAVELVVLHALAKRREERPQTAGELAQELTAAVSGVPIQPAVQAIPAVNPVAYAPLPTPSTPAVPLVAPNSHPTPVSGSVPTMVMQKPAWSSGAVAATPDVTAQPSAVPAESARSKNRMFAIGGAVLLLLVIIGGSMTWFLRSKNNTEGSTSSVAPSVAPTTENKKTPTPPARMAYVPGGEFLMGSNDGHEFERPQHKATVGAFFIDLYEVTNEDYAKFVRATSHQAPTTWANGQYPAGAARQPVTGVNWEDADAYAHWEGKRLPTEEEWEFAARGTDGRRYPWGNDWQQGAANANFDTSTSAQGRLAEVGAYKGVSPFGIFDMVGNAWEWTANDFSIYAGGQTPAQVDEGKVIRGGCYLSNVGQATTTYRRGLPKQGVKYDQTGFRCAKDVSTSSSAENKLELPSVKKRGNGDYVLILDPRQQDAVDKFLSSDSRLTRRTLIATGNYSPEGVQYVKGEIESLVRSGQMQHPYACWGDLNGDGFLDLALLFVTTRPTTAEGSYECSVVVFHGNAQGGYDPMFVTKESSDTLNAIYYDKKDKEVVMIDFGVGGGSFKWNGSRYVVKPIMGD